MKIYAFVSGLIALLSAAALSQRPCPTSEMIRQGNTNGFIFLNANNNLLAGEKMREHFIAHQREPITVDFFEDYITDFGQTFYPHCYYSGDHEVYLGKI